jgi:tyrosine-protein kinase Etk/Wzc
MINKSFEENVNIKDIIENYLRYWKQILIFVIISLCSGFLFLRYTKQKYNIKATLLIKEDNNNNGIKDQLSAFEGLGLNIGGTSNKIENEIELLKSRSLFNSVSKELKLNLTYYNLNSLRKDELFTKIPVKINFIKGDSSIYLKNANFEIRKISNTKFELKDVNSDNKIGVYTLGEKISTSIGEILCLPTIYYNSNDFRILISINYFDKVIDDLQKSVNVELVNKESSIINLNTNCVSLDKGKAILNKIIEVHTIDGIMDKNEISTNTLKFINERIKYITEELTNVEQNVSSFKSNNKIFDLNSNATMFLENESENEKLLSENIIQIQLTEFIIDHLKNCKANELLPYNIGISNIAIDNLINNINNLILERNKLLTRSSDNNPVVINLENQISSLKGNLKESLISHKNSLKITIKVFEREKSSLERKLISAPKQEKDFREIARQQQIKETLYLFLLQKREETAISQAVTVSNIKVIDPPYSDKKVTSPKKTIVLLISLFLGLIIPIAIIYVINLLDTKVQDKSHISNLGIPFIGDIPITDSKNKLVVGLAERSSVAEAFRLLRTNVNFLIPSVKNSAKSIFITSTISNEGKSFIALNLAATLGLSGKKVALLGLDLRAPKILQYINEKKAIGITSFIVDSNISLNDISIKIPEIENLTIIPSGPIPPNPAELLMSDRLSDLFNEVKEQFDYIVVDTAPVGLVADSLLLNKYADMFIYVARANFLDKRLLNIAENLHDESKLKNMSILLNCSDYKRNYGYGYSYGYGEDANYLSNSKKSWFRKFWKK